MTQVIYMENRQIENVIFDVDGVFNTGQFIYTEDGKFGKIFGAHDNDGVKMIKNYVEICCVSADKRGWGITKKRITDDMGLRLEFVPEADRMNWLEKNFDLSRSIYMGDSIHDVEIFSKFAYSIAPANAFYTARDKANFVTQTKSGEGAVLEACLHIIEKFFNIKSQ